MAGRLQDVCAVTYGRGHPGEPSSSGISQPGCQQQLGESLVCKSKLLQGHQLVGADENESENESVSIWTMNESLKSMMTAVSDLKERCRIKLSQEVVVFSVVPIFWYFIGELGSVNQETNRFNQFMIKQLQLHESSGAGEKRLIGKRRHDEDAK